MQRLDQALGRILFSRPVEWASQIVLYAIFLLIIGVLGFGFLILAKNLAEWVWTL